MHIIGFAKVVGDIAAGARRVMLFFLATLRPRPACWCSSTRSRTGWRSWSSCAVVAVVWQLGVIRLLGYGMDPMSILVPFLVFAIAVSHGVQMVSAVGSEIFDGADR